MPLLGVGDIRRGPAGRAQLVKDYGEVPPVYGNDTELAQLHRALQQSGDGHGHPPGRSELSRCDRQTLRQIALSSEARAPMPIMAILAGGGEGANSWRLAVWRLVHWNEWFATGVTTATLLKIRTYSE